MTEIASGVIKAEKWGKDRWEVVIEREGTRYTVARFELHEKALAEQMYQEALHTHVDDFEALRERYSAMRAGAPNALSGGSKPPPPSTPTDATPKTTKELKRLIDEAEKTKRGLDQLRQRAADVNALVRKAELANDRAWAKVEAIVEARKQG